MSFCPVNFITTAFSADASASLDICCSTSQLNACQRNTKEQLWMESLCRTVSPRLLFILMNNVYVTSVSNRQRRMTCLHFLPLYKKHDALNIWSTSAGLCSSEQDKKPRFPFDIHPVYDSVAAVCHDLWPPLVWHSPPPEVQVLWRLHFWGAQAGASYTVHKNLTFMLWSSCHNVFEVFCASVSSHAPHGAGWEQISYPERIKRLKRLENLHVRLDSCHSWWLRSD